MIVDTSVVVAVLRDEPDAARLARSMADAPVRRIAAANYLEAAIVMDGFGDPVVSRRFDQFVAEAGMRIEPVTEEQVKIARQAYRDFGKGSGHPAGLNFGDCFAYALAKDLDEPLLFKGNDFGHTDITAAD